MQIAAIMQHGVAGWPTVKWGPLTPALNALYGPPRSGKTMLANLLADTLFGRSSTAAPGAAQTDSAPGEVFVECESGRYRVRRYRDSEGVRRLTVAGFNGSAVDAGTMRGLVGGLSPAVLAPLCAVSFRQTPDVAALLSAEFARAFEKINGGNGTSNGRRTAELSARRDLLAQELETRIAGERQVSKDLETRCRELDRLIRTEQDQLATIEQSLRATDTSLAETDARLRYRRLELNVRRHGTTSESGGQPGARDEVGEHVLRLRAMLADLTQREAVVRAELAQVQSSQIDGSTAVAETQSWLAVGRQLAADLAGEVARLARASASQQCVCRDAHPRLRPISETIERQLDVLAKLIEKQQQAFVAMELQSEVDQLAHSQAAIRRQLEQLLERIRSRKESSSTPAEVSGGGHSAFSEADVVQLESRRLELEQQGFQFVENMRSHGRTLRDLKAQRETVERQRASLLSARSIEHVQRELTSVQQKLEQAAGGNGSNSELVIGEDNPARASDYLAQLTDGELVRLTLVEQGRRACVVNRTDQTMRVESLPAAQRDQVYISLCLALLSAARRLGVRLPLVLDEPFERLDARGTAALAAVLDVFSRQGHQVVVITGQQAAAERLASVGAAIRDIVSLRQRKTENRPETNTLLAESQTSTRPRANKRTKRTRRNIDGTKKKSKVRRVEKPTDIPTTTDQSDAA